MGKPINPPNKANTNITNAALELILEQERETGSAASKGPTPNVTAKKTTLTPVNNKAAVGGVVNMIE